MNNKTVLVALAIFCCVASVTCSFSSLIKFPRSVDVAVGRTRSVSMEEGLPYCYVGTCLGVGGNCSIPGAQCINSQPVFVVNYTTYDFTCTCDPLFTVGENCSYSYQCASDNCAANGVCQTSTYATVAPGGSCSANTDCYNPNNANANLTCTNGICSGGTPIGAACTVISYCTNGFCAKSTSKCTAQIISGGACNAADSNNCFLGGPCVNGVCQNLTVAAIGGNCSSNPCIDGAFCGANLECYSNSSYTYAACEADNNCTNGLQCECDGLTGAGVCASNYYTGSGSTSAYVNAVNAYESCYFANGCQNNNNDLCVACFAQICPAIKLSIAVSSGYDPKITSTCLYNNYEATVNASLTSLLQQYNCSSVITTSTASTTSTTSATSITSATSTALTSSTVSTTSTVSTASTTSTVSTASTVSTVSTVSATSTTVATSTSSTLAATTTSTGTTASTGTSTTTKSATTASTGTTTATSTKSATTTSTGTAAATKSATTTVTATGSASFSAAVSVPLAVAAALLLIS